MLTGQNNLFFIYFFGKKIWKLLLLLFYFIGYVTRIKNTNNINRKHSINAKATRKKVKEERGNKKIGRLRTG